jgi:multidrug resistance protein, MATE family
MKLRTSYKQILQISLPLIIASFGHSLIGATDTFFLGRSGNTTYLAAIGLVAPLYLVITMVSLALARGGQIMIARRVGENRLSSVGAIAQNMLYFELVFAAICFVLLYYGGEHILWFLIDSPELLDISIEYLNYRVFGIFFGCAGVTFISLYTGVARTGIIIVTSVIMALFNIVLNYLLIFGNYGFPEMGIGGAGLASAISEFFAFIAFLVFALLDKKSKDYHLLRLPKADFKEIFTQIKLSTPLALQNFLGMVSWVFFFGFIENIGEEEMAISSVIRVIYLFLGAIAWGFGSGTNTIISKLIGEIKLREVVPTLFRVSFVSVALTALFSLPLLLIPGWIVNAITDEVIIIDSTAKMMPMLFFILLGTAAYTIFYNGIIGTGDIRISLIITFIGAVLYVAFGAIFINVMHKNLFWAWSVEFIYSGFVLVMCLWYFFKTKRWFRVRV